MIEEIEIKSVATYDKHTPEKLPDLKIINFVYGSNGTGKTTIARLIAKETDYPYCTVKWRGGVALETMVYNRDFIDTNFNQYDELRGIFTLGEKDKVILDKIDSAQKELNSITVSITALSNTFNWDAYCGR